MEVADIIPMVRRAPVRHSHFEDIHLQCHMLVLIGLGFRPKILLLDRYSSLFYSIYIIILRSLQIAVAVELFESVYFDHFYTICSSDWEDARKCYVKAAVFRRDQQNRESSSQYSIQAHNAFTQRSDLHDTHVYRSKY